MMPCYVRWWYGVVPCFPRQYLLRVRVASSPGTERDSPCFARTSRSLWPRRRLAVWPRGLLGRSVRAPRWAAAFRREAAPVPCPGRGTPGRCQQSAAACPATGGVSAETWPAVCCLRASLRLPWSDQPAHWAAPCVPCTCTRSPVIHQRPNVIISEVAELL